LQFFKSILPPRKETSMPVSQLEKAIKFRTLHGLTSEVGRASAPLGPTRLGAFIIPNPWDVGSARMLAALGFEALATTSAGFAFTLGRSDGEVKREEALAHCHTIAEATDLPVSADLENTFGHVPRFVAQTIRLAGATGIVGGSVEDATGNESRPIYDHAHAVERVAAAVEAARALPYPFTLTARAENYFHGRNDLEDTIRRLQAFAAAGADVLYAPGLPSLAAIKAVCAAVAPKPVNVLAGMKGANFPVADLVAAGAKRISLGAALSRVALGAFLKAAKEMKEKGTFNFVDDTITSAELSALLKGFASPPPKRADAAKQGGN
jgi:2-methylisocitrate lyase-like PEP mutase family enzyme